MRTKKVYIYPYYGKLNNDDYEKQRRLISKLIRVDDIIPFPADTNENLNDYIDSNSFVFMESIFSLIDVLKHKKCPYRSLNSIVNHSKDYFDYCLESDVADFLHNCGLREIYFSFNTTPFCDTLDIIFAISDSKYIKDVDSSKFKMITNEMVANAVKQKINLSRISYFCYDIARENGKTVGHSSNDWLKSEETKKRLGKVKELSKDFDGSLSDPELLKELSISRNTLKKYKKLILEQKTVDSF